VPDLDSVYARSIRGRDEDMGTNKKTLILFSDDFDRATAAFVIANGAAAMGTEVTIFFTFWGLALLRKPTKVKTKGKSLLQKLFARMMHRGPGKLGLSKMNFGGIGVRLMRVCMKRVNAMSLEDLIGSAKEQGVKFVACTMSMDSLGFRKEELLDGIEFAGVAAYLAEADEASVNLFI
jgi:peroxiredoxin family protein